MPELPSSPTLPLCALELAVGAKSSVDSRAGYLSAHDFILLKGAKSPAVCLECEFNSLPFRGSIISLAHLLNWNSMWSHSLTELC